MSSLVDQITHTSLSKTHCLVLFASTSHLGKHRFALFKQQTMKLLYKYQEPSLVTFHFFYLGSVEWLYVCVDYFSHFFFDLEAQTKYEYIDKRNSYIWFPEIQVSLDQKTFLVKGYYNKKFLVRYNFFDVESLKKGQSSCLRQNFSSSIYYGLVEYSHTDSNHHMQFVFKKKRDDSETHQAFTLVRTEKGIDLVCITPEYQKHNDCFGFEL